MKNFRTFEISAEFYHQACGLKMAEHLKNQLLRAASSISLNLAESRGKPTIKDQLRFFHIAMGSLRECQAILILAGRKDSAEWGTADHLGACLYKLIRNAA